MLFKLTNFFNMLIVCLLLVSLSACNDEKVTKNKSETQVAEYVIPKGKNFKGVQLQFADIDTFTKMREGLIKELTRQGYKDGTIVIDMVSADGDLVELERLAQELATSNYDFIIPTGTPATQALVRSKTKLPIIYMGLSDPYTAEISVRPDADTTGTLMPITLTNTFKVIKQLSPEIESFGFIHYNQEASAITTLSNAKSYLNMAKITSKETIIYDSSDVEELARNIIQEVDALFILNESLIQKDMPLISKLALEAKKPIYCAYDVRSFTGCLATVSSDPVNVGVITGELLIKYLAGKPIEEIAAKQVVFDNATYINRSVAEKLGIEIPSDLLRYAVFID